MLLSNIPHTRIDTVGGTPIYQFTGYNTVGWKSGLNIDADGSPHAYSPAGSPPGLDYLANAGSPGNWWGIVTDNNSSNGNPIVQGSGDPAPGFYVSSTSLIDPSFRFSDPRAYVDSETIPFIVLPGGHYFGGRIGDLVTVVRVSNGDYCHAIAADVGPRDQIGEGSVALAKALAINPSPKNGGVSSGIGFFFYPGSGNGRPMTVAQINAAAEPLFQQIVAAGGLGHLQAAPDSDWSTVPATPAATPVSNAAYAYETGESTAAGKALQTFLNQYPGIQLAVTGITDRATSDALRRVAGFSLSSDSGPAAASPGGPYVIFDPAHRSDYARLLQQFLAQQSGASLSADGYAGQDTSDACQLVFGHRLAGDPRDGGPVAPGIPYSAAFFSAYAAQLQEFLAGLPGINLKADGYAGESTNAAFRQALGVSLMGAP